MTETPSPKQKATVKYESVVKKKPYREFQRDERIPFESKPILDQVGDMFRMELGGLKMMRQLTKVLIVDVPVRYVKIVETLDPESIINTNEASFHKIKCCNPKTPGENEKSH